MRIKNILVLVLYSFSIIAYAQIFSAGFENNNGTPLSEWKTINADSLKVPSWMPVQDFNDEAWIQFFDGHDNKIAFSTSFYDNGGGKSNDWLITPKIEIPNNGTPTIYWNAKSYDNSNAETYSILVSTTDNNMESFTNLVTIENEQAFEYNNRKADLSAYKGEKIHIAFVNQTDKGLYLALDNVYISNSDNCHGPTIESFASKNVTNNSFDINWGAVDGVNLYDVGVTTFSVPVMSNGVQSTTNKSFTNLSSGTRYQFFVKNADCGSGWIGPKSVFTASELPYQYGFEYTEENYGEYDSDGWSSTTWINGNNESLAQEGAGYIYSNTSTSSETNKWIYSYPIWLKKDDILNISFFSGITSDATDKAELSISIANAQNESSNLAILNKFEVASGTPYKEYKSNYTASETGLFYVGFGNTSAKTSSMISLRLDNVNFKSGGMSVNEIGINEKVEVFPNPTHGILKIDSKEIANKVEIYDFTGKKVKTIYDNNNLNLENLNQGNYLIKIFFDNNITTKQVYKKN